MKLRDVIVLLEDAYPPGTAEDWDRVGLVCGDPEDDVGRVLVAMDPVATVVDEALKTGADLIVTHHPLFLRGTSTVAADTPKGALVHRLIRGGCALYAAHTNADKAPHGTNDALAHLLGLRDVTALVPDPATPLDTLVTFVPAGGEHAGAPAAVIDALAAAGAGRLGDYERAAFTSAGTGTFRPLEGATPTIGAVGATEEVAEERIEMTLPRGRRQAVLDALRAAHPYEEPAFTIVEHAAHAGFAPAGSGLAGGGPGAGRPGERASAPVPVGLGRVGELPEPMTLAAFADLVASVLPDTVPGVLAGGPPQATVRRVALCTGSGDSMLGDARRAGADVYLTADLRHHPASEHLESGPPYLVLGTHYATEAPVLDALAALLRRRTADGDRLAVTVSRRVTDPWTYRATVQHTPDRGDRP